MKILYYMYDKATKTVELFDEKKDRIRYVKRNKMAEPALMNLETNDDYGETTEIRTLTSYEEDMEGYPLGYKFFIASNAGG